MHDLDHDTGMPQGAAFVSVDDPEAQHELMAHLTEASERHQAWLAGQYSPEGRWIGRKPAAMSEDAKPDLEARMLDEVRAGKDSFAKLGGALGVSRKTLYKAARELKEQGLIEIKKQGRRTVLLPVVIQFPSAVAHTG